MNSPEAYVRCILCNEVIQLKDTKTITGTLALGPSAVIARGDFLICNRCYERNHIDSISTTVEVKE